MKNFLRLMVILVVISFAFHSYSVDMVELTGGDSPNDKGEAVDLKWTLDESIKKDSKKIFVFRKAQDESEFKQVKELDITADAFNDKNEVKNHIPYMYYLELRSVDGNVVFKTNEYGPFVSIPQWVNTDKIPTFIFSVVAMIVILIFIRIAKSGRKLYVRPLAGVQAIEDAVGRATEMGKPMIYSPGISVISDIATLASISILSRVSEIVAEFGSRLIVPNYDPIVYSVTDEVVKGAYVKVGRPDAYKADDVYFLTQRQFAYASGVSGLMAREKPAANFFLGWFMAESLILAEAGSMTGAIQIAGTDSISQIPFFIVACDYTLIGEELYAAATLMGEDTRLLGGLKGQDYVKLIAMILLIVLFILKLCGVPGIESLLVVGGN